ncbi:MAG: DUF4331 domain-containing protein [Euzebyales bacterium]|nr:DUF4331 domain-containing protein [Euzebyales bacterium]MDQ3431975.1 DUF4331 domain-containing protein [Actinomycetota bacterium]
MTTARFNLRRRAVALVTAAAASLGGSALLLAPVAGTASSHREAPAIAADPLADNTDTYAFVSPDDADNVTLIANWLPFQEPAGGPNFYYFDPEARYYIHVDNDGDAKPDISYRWTFKSDYKTTGTFLYNTGPVNSLDDDTLNFTQTYTLDAIKGDKTKTLVSDAKVAPSYVGDASMPNYAALRDEAIVGIKGEGRTFAGQADDPFFLDLRVFDLLYGGDLSETGTDTLNGFNVQSVALEVPSKHLTRKKDPVIGVWSTTERRSSNVVNADGTREASGDFVQVSRLGNPLVNEVVIPLELKDAFNSLEPENDASVAAAVDRVNDPELPKLIEQIYGIPAPKTPRDDLFAVFLTGIEGLNKPKGEVTPAEMLRLNTSIEPTDDPDRLGVLAKDTAGFPNGRRLEDDVVDIALQAVEGAVRTGELVEALATGDGVDVNDVAFGDSFPYLALPHSGSMTAGAGAASSAPSGGIDAGGGGTAAGNPRGVLANGGGPANQQQGLPVLPASLAVLGVALGAAGLVSMRRSRSAS